MILPQDPVQVSEGLTVTAVDRHTCRLSVYVQTYVVDCRLVFAYWLVLLPLKLSSVLSFKSSNILLINILYFGSICQLTRFECVS